MSLRECIAEGLAEGLITETQARAATDLFGEFEIQYRQKMSPEAAAQKAAQDTFEKLKGDAQHTKRVKLLQIQRYRGITKDLARYANPDRPGKALVALIDKDIRAPFNDLDHLSTLIKAQAQARMDKILARHRKGIFGQTKHKAELYTLVKEIFGDDTGNIAAREMAQGWAEAAEYLRLRANAAGMRIPKRVDWGLPQHHDRISVRAAGSEEWKKFIRPLLHREKMIDESTGRPFSDAGLEQFLSDVYATIESGGLNKITSPAFGTRGKSLANRRGDHRFLVFENADGWLNYQQKFGEPDAFSTMVRHLESMSRDIALLETFGPNPNSMIAALKVDAKKRADAIAAKTPGNDTATSRVDRDLSQFDTMYKGFTLELNVPVNQTLSDWGASIRNLMNASLLGAASITAISDFNTQRMAAAMIGMPSRKVVSRVMKEMSLLGREERGKAAIRMGLAANSWIQTAYAQARFLDEVTGPEVTRRISDTVLRVSLLTPFTQAGRNAFGIEFTLFVSSLRDKKFADLPKGMQEQMRNHSIGEGTWNIIRETKLHEDPETGVAFIRAEDIEARTDLAPGVGRDAATRLMHMRETLTDFAVPTSSLRARAFLKGKSEPGTPGGEILASFAQFKSFPVTIMHNHIGRFLLDPAATAAGKVGNIANLIIGATVMGALATQLSDISKLRDPRPMTTAAFWGAAMLKGGGLGIYGDFFFSRLNRFGSGLESTIAGPSAGALSDLRNLTFGNLSELIEGEDTNFGSELVKFMARYAPGTSIWYLRASLERNIFDNLQRWMDPSADRKMRRRMRSHAKEYGAESWWESGQDAPHRAPDLSNILREQ